ncbi:hypothetical protein BDQ17DRAFT_721185 [Cyathus striatus]|nr:hypothetical protein BDQ17DRAFT_721185 [Cyathus striatus]
MTIHGTVKGESVRGTPYNNEYILMLHFAPLQMGESEQKICFVKEFVDSDTIIKFYAEDAARARAGGERSNSNSNRSIRSIENAPPRGRETMRPDVANGRESPRKREHQGYYVPARS